MALDFGAGIKIGDNELLEKMLSHATRSTPVDVWLKETVLATWGKPGISYPNGDSISFGFGLRTRGGRVVARY